MTSTVLKDLAIPGKSLLAPGFPGYNEDITKYAVFDVAKAKEHLAKAGYPNGDGFPEIEIWYRDQGGYNGAITAPMLQYLQAEYKEHLGIDMLTERLQSNVVKELILATNLTVEGEATAHFIADKAKTLGVEVSRIAYGVPMGGELEYVDGGTLNMALQSRKTI